MRQAGDVVTQRKRPTPYWLVGVWWAVMLLNLPRYNAERSTHWWAWAILIAWPLFNLAVTAYVIREHVRFKKQPSIEASRYPPAPPRV